MLDLSNSLEETTYCLNTLATTRAWLPKANRHSQQVYLKVFPWSSHTPLLTQHTTRAQRLKYPLVKFLILLTHKQQNSKHVDTEEALLPLLSDISRAEYEWHRWQENEDLSSLITPRGATEMLTQWLNSIKLRRLVQIHYKLLIEKTFGGRIGDKRGKISFLQ
jgi:hypothetical protein